MVIFVFLSILLSFFLVFLAANINERLFGIISVHVFFLSSLIVKTPVTYLITARDRLKVVNDGLEARPGPKIYQARY